MIDPNAERIAKRLGLTDAVICRLQARGHLQRLAVTPGELDARIYRAYVAHSPGAPISASRPRSSP